MAAESDTRAPRVVGLVKERTHNGQPSDRFEGQAQVSVLGQKFEFGGTDS